MREIITCVVECVEFNVRFLLGLALFHLFYSKVGAFLVHFLDFLDFLVTSIYSLEYLFHNVLKLLKMSHLNFSILTLSTNFFQLKVTCLTTLFGRKL